MNILLPELGKAYCNALTVRGEIVDTKDSPRLKPVRTARSLIASYRTGGKPAHIRIPGGSSPQYFQIDFALRSAFPLTAKPKANTPITDIKARISSLAGLKLKANLAGAFVIPVTRLGTNGLLATLCGEQKKERFSFQLIAGTLRATGLPMDELEWSIGADEASVRITRQFDVEIAEDFLVRCLEFITAGFDVIVSGEGRGGQR
jgi:hypothetical protein